MSASDWEREKAIFLAALERAPDEREAWVAEATHGAPALAAAVRSLLAAHRDTDDFLETPAADLAKVVSAAETRIGSYRLLREIGRGGMGTVHLAVRDDGEFAQEVAVKLVKRGMDTDGILARFRHERQILASLAHPNIARLLDGGTTADGRPYFVMEYVAGESVRAYAEQHALSVDARLTLFRTICGAVEHAHRNLVVHRDLKSSNILVTADGVPKLLDFGIAKLLDPNVPGDATHQTTLVAFTPEYASPEQLRGAPVTTATDVYSLGVLLYELLTGERPYETRGHRPDDLAQLVATTEPLLPSVALRRTDGRRADRRQADRLRGDLDTIVMMAMHKDAARRYASVAQFAEDIERHQRGLPVRARPDSLGYRAASFARRHRAGLAAGVLVVLTLVTGLVASLSQARRAERERARAERRFAEVRSLATTFLFDVHDAIRSLPGSTPARALLIRQGLASLDGLAREAQGDTALQRDLALAYQRIGEVQGNSYGANLGDTQGALRSYQRAVALLEAIGAARSRDSTTQRAMVEGYRGLAVMLASTGELSRSQPVFAQAIALQRPLVAAHPTSVERRALLANLLQELGNTRGGTGQSNLGDTVGAMTAYREALVIRETLLRERPTDVETRAAMATLDFEVGSLALAMHDTSGAAMIRRGVALLEQIVADRPDDAERRNELLAGYGRLRTPLLDAKRYAAAIAIDEKILRSLQTMTAADPQNSLLQRNLGVTFNYLARDHGRNGEPALAVANHRRALAIAERLHGADPASMEALRDLAFTLDVLAEALANDGQRSDAVASYRRAIAYREQLRRAEAENPEHDGDIRRMQAEVARLDAMRD